MRISYEDETGWPSAGNLEQRVAAYVRNGRLREYSRLAQVVAAIRRAELRGFRVGITNSPSGRAALYGTQYDEMICIYRTDSLKNARKWEEHLIEYFRERADNLYLGGGRSAEDGPYYVYVCRNGRD